MSGLHGHTSNMLTCFILVLGTVLMMSETASVTSSSRRCSCELGLHMCDDELCSCIPRDWVCDGRVDCEDKSDEFNCTGSYIVESLVPATGLVICKSTEWRCINSKHCVLESVVCDGHRDCPDNSDELHCSHMSCSASQFQCSNGRCIDRRWLCDGDNDCLDMSDETCSLTSCEADEFQCEDGGCISALWHCDLDVDCEDGSDEQLCAEVNVTSCPDLHFLCNNTARCLPASYVCDGENDCDDYSDELNCHERSVHCGSHEVPCGSMCISESWRCDGDIDCQDESDELGCSPSTVSALSVVCTGDMFQCDVSKCIHSSWRCDMEFDCMDRTDERDCNHTVTTDENVCVGEYRCVNGQCVGLNKICDGRFDCSDQSDETHCTGLHVCQPSVTTTGGCCQLTVNTTNCSCPPGHLLATDKRTCTDYDECLSENLCSQSCTNTPGSYYCSCVAGYQLRPDQHSCKALGGEPALILANRVDIRKLVPGSHHATEFVSLVEGLQNAVAIDIHFTKQLLFWTDVTLDHIKRVYINRTAPHGGSICFTPVADIISTGLDSPGGLAIDWIHNLLFWTDAGTSRIEVSQLDGSMRKVIHWKDVDKPRAIATDPEHGTIYWTDWGSMARIERSSMDGQDRRVLVNSSLYWPNGLTIDFAASKIFWTDARHHVIESANLDGSHRKTVLNKGLPHPFGISVFEDDIFWTDWHTRSVSRVNRFDVNKVHVIHTRLHYPMDLCVSHPLRQPTSANHCGVNNGLCSHLCLPNLSGFSCACPTGFKLLPNGRQCTENLSSFILLVRREDIRRISLDTEDMTDVVVPVTGLKSAIALDWDSETDYIYWSDFTLDSISRARWDGTGQEVLISDGVESVAGLAVDWITHKLYWTEVTAKRIEVSNMDGTMRTVIVSGHMDGPRNIVLDPQTGSMYWLDWSQPPVLEHSGMDGSARRTLITFSTKHSVPASLAIDYDLRQLYWIDLAIRQIEMSDMDGNNHRIFLSLESPGLPFSVAIHRDTLYWTDISAHNIESINKLNSTIDRKVICRGLDALMNIKVFNRQRPRVRSACALNNGGCSHLCLLSPTTPNYTCACPMGILLTDDKSTCNNGVTNMLLLTRRADLRIISLDVDYFADVVVPINTDLKNTVSADVDPITGLVYWSDIILDKVSGTCLNGSCEVFDVLTNGLDTVDGIAVDYISRHLYWTDAQHNSISVVSLVNSTLRSVLISQNIDSPRSIALHYTAGCMFWTDWGKQPRVERAFMDGSNRVTLITDNLGWPNSVTVDVETSRIIWVDAKTEVVECSRLDGSERHLLVTSVNHPYGVAVTGGYVYWTDWETQSVLRANSTTGQSVTTVRSKLPGIMDLHAVNLLTHKQTDVDVCGANNGGCSDLCLRTPSGFSCVCRTGIKLQADNRTCSDVPERHLLVAMRNSIRRISLDTEDLTDVTLPLLDVHNVIALDVDIADRKIYFTDVHLDVIRCADLTGQNVETIVESGSSTMDGIAVDWIAKNIYWTDTGLNVIAVARVNGSWRMSLVSDDLDEPRAITVHPVAGYLFWTDWGQRPKIERSYLDGTKRVAIVTSRLAWPNGLSVDYITNSLYWVDAKLDCIETSDLDGQQRNIILNHVSHPFGLSMSADYIYVTDWQLQGIERIDKLSEGLVPGGRGSDGRGRGRTVLNSKLEGVMDIQYIDSDIQTGTNPCAVNNGGCIYLCFYRPTGHICVCPENYLLHTAACQTNESNSFDRNSFNEQRSISSTPAVHKQHVVVVVVVVVIVVVVFLICGILFTAILIAYRQNSCRRQRTSADSNVTLTFANPSFYNSHNSSTCSQASVNYCRPWRLFQTCQYQAVSAAFDVTNHSNHHQGAHHQRIDHQEAPVACHVTDSMTSLSDTDHTSHYTYQQLDLNDDVISSTDDVINASSDIIR